MEVNRGQDLDDLGQCRFVLSISWCCFPACSIYRRLLEKLFLGHHCMFSQELMRSVRSDGIL